MNATIENRRPQRVDAGLQKILDQLPDAVTDEQREVLGQHPDILHRYQRVAMMDSAAQEALKRRHDWALKIHKLREARSAGDVASWQEHGGHMITTGEGHERMPSVDQYEQLAIKVETAIQATSALFRFRMLELFKTPVTQEDVETYFREVVLPTLNVPKEQEEAALRMAIDSLFVEGKRQNSITLRMSQLDNPVSIERLNGVIETSLNRSAHEEHAAMIQKYGESSPIYQAYTLLYKIAGVPGHA